MACPPDALPLPPTVLSFAPYSTFAAMSCSPFAQLVGNGVLGTHLDTRVIVQRVKPVETIVDRTMGVGQTSFTLTSLGLIAGLTYSCRVAYANQVGFGKFSKLFLARVPAELDLPAVTVPTEPFPVAPQALPLEPSFVARPESVRDSIEWITEAGDTIRRLKQEKPRRASQLTWDGLTTVEKDTIRGFLLDRLAAVEPFQTTDHVHGTALWFVRRGTIETIQLAPGTWNVQAQVDEIVTERMFTVGVSTIGGPDPIR